MGPTRAMPALGLRILSVEDEPGTLEGPLSSLELDGHTVERAEDVETAEERLRSKQFDVVLVDQRLPHAGRIDYDGGSKLVARLKTGELGGINRETPFLFVTGSRAWIPDAAGVLNLTGYLGVIEKGSDLTPRLRATLPPVARHDAGRRAEVIGRLVAEEIFDSQMHALGLAEDQIGEQSLEELTESLERVNEALTNPDSFGIIDVRLASDGSVVDSSSVHDAQMRYGILPVLLQSKRTILRRMRELGGAEAIRSLEQLAQVGATSTDQANALVAEALANARIAATAGQQESQLALEVTRKRELIEITRARAEIWHSFLARESMASIVGGLLLVVLSVALIVAMFTNTAPPEVVVNAFLLILGYFFGQSAARSRGSKEED
jgi:CheY-like chemotaxis protein